MERQNDELFLALRRGEDRVKQSDSAYKTKKWRARNAVVDSDESEDDIFDIRRRSQK